MQDVLSGGDDFNLLSLEDLLQARELYHRHLMHKAHVVATAVGKYLIRVDDPWPSREDPAPKPPGQRGERRLDNSEVRPYSWPCLLVFVDEWEPASRFGGGADTPLDASDMVPKALYMPNGLTVPTCVVSLALGRRPEPPQVSLRFAPNLIGGGYPVLVKVQEHERVGSIGCLVTDGHLVYALTNRHVVGEPGTAVYTEVDGAPRVIGRTARLALTKLPFQDVYPSLPGQRVTVNLDVGLVEVADLNRWTAQVYGIGELGPLADLSEENLSLRLIGAPVRAHGAVSGPLRGQVHALFYRYKAVGGFEYVADFLIGPRPAKPPPAPPEAGAAGVRAAARGGTAGGAAGEVGAAGGAASGGRAAAADGAEAGLPAAGEEPDESAGTQVQSLPGDSGTLWLLEQPRPRLKGAAAAGAPPAGEPPEVDYRPLAVEWGGEVVLGASADCQTYVLASALSTVCRLLDLDVIRDWNVGLPDYWGQRGHYTVASLAVDRLPDGKLKTLMRNNLANVSYRGDQLRRNSSGRDADGFVRLANVPDLVWKDRQSGPGHFPRRGRENPNHYADVDKPRPADGKTLLQLCQEDPSRVNVPFWNQYYTDADTEDRGTLPFRVQQIYQEMVRSAAAGDSVRFVCAAGVLAHYVGDACQPLHCSFMADGIPAADPGAPAIGEGVHGAYETAMIDAQMRTASGGGGPGPRLPELLAARLATLPAPARVRGGPKAAQATVALMEATVATLAPAEIIRVFVATPAPAAMWASLGERTVTVMARGIQYLAMLWASAWAEGRGSTKVNDTSAIPHGPLRALYEPNDPATEFLPSRTMARIAEVLE